MAALSCPGGIGGGGGAGGEGQGIRDVGGGQLETHKSSVTRRAEEDRRPNICFHTWKDSNNALTSKILNPVIITPPSSPRLVRQKCSAPSPISQEKKFPLNVKFALPAEEKDGRGEVTEINVVPSPW